MWESHQPTHLLTLGHHVSFVSEPQRLNGPTWNSGLNNVWAHTKSSPAHSFAYAVPPHIFQQWTTQVEWAYMKLWSNKVWAHARILPVSSFAYIGPSRLFRQWITQVEWVYTNLWSIHILGPCENLAAELLASSCTHTGPPHVFWRWTTQVEWNILLGTGLGQLEHSNDIYSEAHMGLLALLLKWLMCTRQWHL